MDFEIIFWILLGIAQIGGLILGLWLGNKWYKKHRSKQNG